MKHTKLIFSPQLAKFLLQTGEFRIIDLKPKRDHEDEVVFVFESNCDFEPVIAKFKMLKQD
jgi:hypothetical protein